MSDIENNIGFSSEDEDLVLEDFKEETEKTLMFQVWI